MADLSALVGTEVRQIRLDYQVTLVLVDGPAHNERASGVLQIEADFRLETASGTSVVCPGAQDTLGPVSQLLRLTVVSAEMDEDQTLVLSFSDGSTVTVQRDHKYESWNLPTTTNTSPTLVL